MRAVELAFAFFALAPAAAWAQHAEDPHAVDGEAAHADDHGGDGEDGANGGHHGPDPINWTEGITSWRSYADKDVHGGSLEPEEAPMAPPLFLALVNFVIFAGLIGWKAGPALRKHFNNKHETIKGALEEAARLRQEAKDKLEEYGKRIADVDDEVNQVIEQIRQEAEAERKKIIADAEAEAARTKAEAEARITAEIEAAKRSLEREVVAAAALATEKLLREKTSAADQNNLFTSFLAGIDGEAPKKSTPPPAAPAAPAAGATDDGWS